VTVTFDRRIAGRIARITIDRAIEPRLAAPFADLPRDAGSAAPDLEIQLDPLDEATAATLAASDLRPSGILESSADGRYVHHRQPQCTARLDRETGRIVAAVRSWGDDAGLAARPLLALLSIACADRDVDVVHAALVSRDGRGILIAGPNGAGKSTTALAAMIDGWKYLGDDCVALARRGDAFIGSSVFASACLEPGHLAGFAPQLPAARFAAGRKSLVSIPAGAPEADAVIEAIVLPRVVGGGDVVIRPLDAKSALVALGPSSILRRAVPAAAALARLRHLAVSCPCYALEMGPPDRVGARLRDVLGAGG
jgi:HPr kinase/phosphorylase